MLFAALLLLPRVAGAAGGETMDIVARDPDGGGMLCSARGKRVLFLAGGPRRMGTAHGRLLKPQIHKIVERAVYVVGGVYSFQKGTWFFDEMEKVWARTEKHLPRRYIAEVDALSAAAGVSRRDGRYANLIPEMFHCSGFAVRGTATRGGTVLHARVLDYMTEVGFQELAVLMVFLPADRFNWLNVGYAGFAGTVTAINEKGLAIGELGGRGEGDWDGVPMTFLLRDVMERAATVREAVDIIRTGPRTCEYYYVITDRSGDMAGIHATAEKMEVLAPGQQHPRLPAVPPDTIIFSAGGRLDVLAKRINDAYGSIDVKTMIEIIKRPVAMRSNLHNAVFAPETLDVWYADAEKDGKACDEPYVHFNLAKLLAFYREHKDERGKNDGGKNPE